MCASEASVSAATASRRIAATSVDSPYPSPGSYVRSGIGMAATVGDGAYPPYECRKGDAPGNRNMCGPGGVGAGGSEAGAGAFSAGRGLRGAALPADGSAEPGGTRSRERLALMVLDHRPRPGRGQVGHYGSPSLVVVKHS